MSSTALMDDGKRGGPPSDGPWTPPSEPKSSPDGGRAKYVTLS
ncbi:hypothetical protein ACFYOI_20360 [Streptomyces microflavus]